MGLVPINPGLLKGQLYIHVVEYYSGLKRKFYVCYNMDEPCHKGQILDDSAYMRSLELSDS